MGRKIQDLSGQKFGCLTVLGKSSKKDSRLEWQCCCVCGQIVIVAARHLKSGSTKSCGCLRRKRMADINYKHGATNTPTFNIWLGMMNRCYGATTGGFKKYGAKGIGVCPEWHDFQKFLNDMGERPSGMTIDRIDNSQGYYPSNCRWLTNRQQQNNKTTNIYLEYGDERLTVTQWADKLGIHKNTLYYRIRCGKNVQQVLFGKNI